MSQECQRNDHLSVNAIAGTHVVLLGLDVNGEALDGLLGFAIHVNHHQTNHNYWLNSSKKFSEKLVPELQLGRQDSRTAPIQDFLWGDYVVTPGQTYTYTVVPIYGDPGAMTAVVASGVEVTINTESEESAKHAIFFNRGVAGSQAYSRMFGDYRKYYLTEKFGRVSWQEQIRPAAVPRNKAWQWLSRGLEEAMLAFVAQAQGPEYAIRASLYELTHAPILEAFAAAMEGGADVKIVHHSKHKTRTEKKEGRVVLDEVGEAAFEAIKHVGLKDLDNAKRWLRWNNSEKRYESDVFIERTHTTISHNKYIILLKNGKPIQVWSGSTNITAGGIFGQSNVGHIIRDEAIANAYLEYWTQLKDDPKKGDLTKWNIAFQPDLDLDQPAPDNSITTIFSPRPSTGMLEWYAKRVGAAQSSVHFTAAFGVSVEMGEELVADKRGTADSPYLSYILLEKPPSRKDKDKAMAHDPQLNYYDSKAHPQNRVAHGDVFRDRHTGHHLEESLTGLNTFVDFLHTKYLLIDPLSDNPTVISGSANFSNNSTINNDENMLVIQGDKRVAHIFLTEFMRLFNHFHVRNVFNDADSDAAAEEMSHLTPDNSWLEPFFTPDTQEFQQRLLFR